MRLPPAGVAQITAGSGLAGGVKETHLFGEDFRLINNRQGGRRRGRGGGGGGRQQSGPGPGNRQENRNRGNAAQLLEKYKSMARDAQMGGDRVQTEYYLQYAEHYYRVLNENRARFEEQRGKRDDYYDEDEGEDESISAEGGDGGDGDDRDDRDERPYREERGYRDDRPERQGRDERPGRGDREERQGRDDRPARDGRGDREERPRFEHRNGEARRGRNRGEREQPAAESEERIALDVLPPAISAVPAPEAADEQPKPRRRARRPRDDGDEIAPAA